MVNPVRGEALTPYPLLLNPATMANYPIEKNIPMPPQKHRYGPGCLKYPFDQMAIGDSFSLDKEEKVRASVAASNYGARHDMKFAVRHMGNDEYRCWRTK